MWMIWMACAAPDEPCVPVSEVDPAATTPPPGPIEGGALVATDTQLVALGGFDGTDVTDRVWILPLGAEGWIAGPPLPEPRQHLAAWVLDERLVVAGGDTGAAHHEVWSAVLEPEGLGPWREEEPLARATAFAGRARIQGELWLLGGLDRDGTPTDRILRGVATEGDLAWEVAGRLPSATFGAAAVVLGDEIVVAGGANAALAGSTATWRATVGEGGLGDWVEGPALPVGVLAGTLVEAGGAVFAAGGFTGDRAVDGIWRLDGAEWRRAGRLPSPRFSMLAATRPDGRLHGVGGWEGAFDTVLEDAWSADLCGLPDR